MEASYHWYDKYEILKRFVTEKYNKTLKYNKNYILIKIQ